MNGPDTGRVAGFLKTGDVVLFAGRGLGHGFRAWLSRQPWSHVGLVLRRQEDPEPLLWEACGSGWRRGTILVHLAARIAGFSGRICVRCLNRALTAAQCEQLDALRRELAGRSHDRGLLDLIAAADDGWLGAKPEHLGEPTDAELVAEAYQRLGLLDDVKHGGLPPSRFRPRRFAERSSLQLKNGYTLGPELVLHDPDHGLDQHGAQPQTARA